MLSNARVCALIPAFNEAESIGSVVRGVRPHVETVILIDDANWEEPREETKRAIRDLGWTVLYETLLAGAYNGDQAGWWNGLLVELIEQ